MVDAFQAEAAIWLKDGLRLKGESNLSLHLYNAGVLEDKNFTCIPFNKATMSAYIHGQFP
jgi:hypothetical protein